MSWAGGGRLAGGKLRKSSTELRAVRPRDNGQVRRVVELIERYCCALEQEALLIDVATRE